MSGHYQPLISTKLHEKPGIQSLAAAAVVTMDTDVNMSLRDRLVSMRIPNNVERYLDGI